MAAGSTRIAALALIAVALAGCQSWKGSGRPVSGTVAGGIVGTDIGRDLSYSDQRIARDAEFRALEFGGTGQPVKWRSGSNYGEVVPGARYRINTFDCRDYTHTISIEGKVQSARGTACRQPNGGWQTVS
jgi:surface antigen